MNHRSLAFRLAVWYALLLSATFALVGAGMLSVLVFPMVGLRRLRAVPKDSTFPGVAPGEEDKQDGE